MDSQSCAADNNWRAMAVVVETYIVSILAQSPMPRTWIPEGKAGRPDLGVILNRRPQSAERCTLSLSSQLQLRHNIIRLVDHNPNVLQQILPRGR